jgi:hypothetical protein
VPQALLAVPGWQDPRPLQHPAHVAVHADTVSWQAPATQMPEQHAEALSSVQAVPFGLQAQTRWPLPSVAVNPWQQ